MITIFGGALRVSRIRTKAKLAMMLCSLALCACETPPPAKPAPVAAPVVAPVATDTAKANQLVQEAALREMVALQDRLYRVAAPLLVNNVALCPHFARNLLGFTAKNKYSYSSEFIDSTQRILGLGDQLQVMGVIAGSGAAKAGLQSGDKLVSINGVPLPSGPNAETDARAVLVPLLSERTTIDLTVNRNGSELSLKLPLTHACAFGIELGNTAIVNAYADGRRVMVTRGMMKMAESDDELAYVLADQMAHDVLGHAGKQHTSGAIAEIIDNLSRAHPDGSVSVTVKPSAQEFEVAADKRGLYMAARAGYAVDNAGKFLTRLAAQYPATASDSFSAAHPLNANRLAAIDKVTTEIKGKQAAKKPVLP
ncbi:MAG TPA: M48 family metallopeptidase [Burkholderiaceae bacterium]|jgi:hypothetical protein|nr:M48 family metallopeptidase [Burkholderiaceae bacterium]